MKILKMLRTASLNSELTGSYKKCVLDELDMRLAKIRILKSIGSF